MTNTHAKTLPPSVKNRALWAIAHLQAWNAAVHQARAMEALAGCPGRYEYDLIVESNPAWTGRILGGHTLDLLEATATGLGWSVEAFYAAVGQPRPAILPEGTHVGDWDKGQR